MVCGWLSQRRCHVLLLLLLQVSIQCVTYGLLRLRPAQPLCPFLVIRKQGQNRIDGRGILTE